MTTVIVSIIVGIICLIAGVLIGLGILMSCFDVAMKGLNEFLGSKSDDRGRALR